MPSVGHSLSCSLPFNYVIIVLIEEGRSQEGRSQGTLIFNVNAAVGGSWLQGAHAPHVPYVHVRMHYVHVHAPQSTATTHARSKEIGVAKGKVREKPRSLTSSCSVPLLFRSLLSLVLLISSMEKWTPENRINYCF